MELKYNTLFQMLLKYLLKDRSLWQKTLILYHIYMIWFTVGTNAIYHTYIREWGFNNMKATDSKSSKIMVSERGNSEDGFSKTDKKDIKIFDY